MAKRDLTAEVTDFAQELIRTVEAVLPEEHGFTAEVGPSSNRQHVIVNQDDDKGIPIAIGGQTVLRLEVSYRCEWNTTEEHFTVNESSFKVGVEGVNEPILTFDYGREFGDTVPVAHVNVHAHRDELMFAFMTAERGRGKPRGKGMQRGQIPRLSKLHIPLGGHRFRPSLEDVLEMLIHEFGIDCKNGALEALRAGRRKFRSIQVSAATGDDPEAAATTLRAMGYTVKSPDPSPQPKARRLSRY